MKSWEDLTKAEKEKLDMYIKIMALWQPIYLVITFICMLSILISIPLLFTAYAPLAFSGVLLIIFSGYLFLFMAALMMQDKKRIYLIFGVESLTKDMFEIKKEDLRKVKKVLIKEK